MADLLIRIGNRRSLPGLGPGHILMVDRTYDSDGLR